MKTFIWHYELNSHKSERKQLFLSKQQLYIHLHRADFRNHTSKSFFSESHYCTKILFRFVVCYYVTYYRDGGTYAIHNVRESLVACSDWYTPEFYMIG